MTNYPKRTGFKLTYDAERLYNDWEEHGGCSCHTGCAPCSSCCHEGNPISLEENDEAWEIDEEEEMARDNITDKGSVGNKDQPFPIGSKVRRIYCGFQKLKEGEIYTVKGYSGAGHRYPHIFVEEHNMPAADCSNFELVREDKPKSQWFGYKYRVTPESSKLLQEAVFADGGGWGHTKGKVVSYVDRPFLIVRGNEITFSNDEYYFETNVFLPEKEPPSTKKEDKPKEFKVGRWYKCIKADISYLEHGKYYKLSKQQGGLLFEQDMYNYYQTACFDVNSESDYDPNAIKALQEEKVSVQSHLHEGNKTFTVTCYDLSAGKDLSVTMTKAVTLNNFNQQEDVNMTNVTRRVVNVKFFDEDAGLDVADSLVAFYDNVVTQDSDESTVRELLMNLDVAAKIEAHNKVRAKTVDLEILRNTGNEVTLRPIKLKDLRIEVTKA